VTAEGRGSRGIRSSHWSAGAGADARWTRARSDILKDYSGVRHVTGTGSGLLGEIPRVVVQKSALT
jgi:hypothetical protein